MVFTPRGGMADVCCILIRHSFVSNKGLPYISDLLPPTVTECFPAITTFYNWYCGIMRQDDMILAYTIRIRVVVVKIFTIRNNTAL